MGVDRCRGHGSRARSSGPRCTSVVTDRPLRTDKRGRTNLQRIAHGDPPIGADGQSINLHQTTQQHGGALAEVESTFHTDDRRVLHVN